MSETAKSHKVIYCGTIVDDWKEFGARTMPETRCAELSTGDSAPSEFCLDEQPRCILYPGDPWFIGPGRTQFHP